jgi:taurine dioxygenase
MEIRPLGTALGAEVLGLDVSRRHRWSPGDFVIWDNRCTMHIALADYNERRRMHRVSVLGDGPVAAA